MLLFIFILRQYKSIGKSVRVLPSKAKILGRFYNFLNRLYFNQYTMESINSTSSAYKTAYLQQTSIKSLGQALKSSIQNESLMPFFLISIIFFIPISPSLKSIFIGITTALIFFMPGYQQRFFSILSQRVSIAALILSGIALLACSWSVANFPHPINAAEKYFKVLYIPLFAIGFTNRKTRTIGIHAFLLSTLIVSILSIAKHWHLLVYNSSDPGQVFHNHIVTGYMTAFAAYLSGLYVTRSKQMKRLFYMLLTTLFTYQVLFVNTGRTGYIVYFILLMLFIGMSFSSKRQLMALLIFSTVLGGIIINVPSVLSNGIHQALNDLNNYKEHDKNTSVGYRLQFHQYAKSLFLSSPIIGYGTGGFKAQFKKDNPIPARGDHLNDPHSQYWFVASELGLIGIAGLCYFLMTLLLMSFHLNEMKAILLGLLMTFFFANITDSFLTNTGIGYMFVMFCALCFGEYIENNTQEIK